MLACDALSSKPNEKIKVDTSAAVMVTYAKSDSSRPAKTYIQ